MTTHTTHDYQEAAHVYESSTSLEEILKEYFNAVEQKDGTLEYLPDYGKFTARLRGRFCPVTFNGAVYIYDSVSGLYREDVGFCEISQAVQSILEAAAYDRSFIQVKREVTTRLRDSNVIPGTTFPFNQYCGFPVENGVVVFDEEGSIVLEPYSPEMMYTRKAPVRYDPDADTHKIWEILSQWVEPEDVLVLIQIAAQAVVQSLPGHEPFKKSYISQGEANGGKSTYLAALELLFGKENTAQLSMQDICGGDNYANYNLLGKWINIGDDVDELPLERIEEFKKRTGKRQQKIEKKFKDAYTGDITAVHVFSCNRPPEVKGRADTDDAFWIRWEYVKFPNYFEKIDGWMAKNFTPATLEGFLLITLECACSILNGGLLISSEADEVREQWKNDSTPLMEFIQENVDFGSAPTDWIPKAEFWEALQSWAIKADDTDSELAIRKRKLPNSVEALGRAMLRVDGIQSEQKGKHRVRVFTGVRWKASSPYAPKQHTVNAKL